MHLVVPSPLTELKIVPEKPTAPKGHDREDAAKKQKSREKAARTREKNARAKRKEAAAENKLKRKARAAKVKKIDQRAADKKAGVPPGLHMIPAQIAHCMMALHVKRGKSKEAAWNICRWSMTKHGYLKGPYRKNTKLPRATAQQTAKGSRRSFQHGMEKGPLGGGVKGNGTAKFKRFMRMFKRLEPSIVAKQKKSK